MDPLIDFLVDRRRNEWIAILSYSIYVRRGYHVINDEMLQTLDIANVENSNVATRGRGGFKMLLKIIEDILHVPYVRGDIQAIYIESILNPQLEASLPNLGYTYLPDRVPPSCYKYVQGLSEGRSSVSKQFDLLKILLENHHDS